MFIYLIVNRETGKYYIGQHKGNNLKKYLQTKLSSARHHHNGQSHLFNSMRKYPQSSLWSIHALRSDIQTREELDKTERDFIKFLKAQNPEYGYNICRGGEGFTGTHSPATRQKLSASIRIGMSTIEYRQKRSLNSKEMWQRPGYRENHIKKIKETLASPEKRAEKSKISKRLWFNKSAKMLRANIEAWSNPKKHAKRVEAIKAGHANPQAHIKCSKASKQTWSNSEHRVKMTKVRKNIWSNPEFRPKEPKP